MNRTLLSLLILTPKFLFGQAITRVDTSLPAGYKLVWADEFDKDGAPDPTNWTYEKGFVRNEEQQWYQPENAYCRNGLLVIEALREQKPNPNFVADSRDWRRNRPNIEYTSSCLTTAGLRTWKYGRFEMRARFDIDPGCWPAWWTLGIEHRWPANGEIDIMEYYRNRLLANIACQGPDHRAHWSSKWRPVDSLGGSAWSSQFHTWRMDWDEKSITLSVDGIVWNSVLLKDFIDEDGTHFEPFKQPHYMLLNLAIGGQNGGNPGNTSFPRRLEVDYIRVYQRPS